MGVVVGVVVVVLVCDLLLLQQRMLRLLLLLQRLPLLLLLPHAHRTYHGRDFLFLAAPVDKTGKWEEEEEEEEEPQVRLDFLRHRRRSHDVRARGWRWYVWHELDGLAGR